MNKMENDRELLNPRESIKTMDSEIALQLANSYAVTRPPMPQPLPPVGPNSSLLNCPFCSASVKTSIKYTSTTRTHGTALQFCLLIPFCGCCLPHCMESTRNVDHYCPNCTKFLGTYYK